MSAYIQTGLTELLIATDVGSSTTLENTGSPTLQLLNTGSEVVYITATASPTPSQAITVSSVDSSGLFTCSQTTLTQGQPVVIGGTIGNANVTLTTGTYYVGSTDGLTTGFYISNAAVGGTNYVPGNIGNGNVAASSYTFTVPAEPTPTAPVIPHNNGDVTAGFALTPNTPTYLTVPGWRSGNILVQAVGSTGGDSILITPVLTVGDQPNVY